MKCNKFYGGIKCHFRWQPLISRKVWSMTFSMEFDKTTPPIFFRILCILCILLAIWKSQKSEKNAKGFPLELPIFFIDQRDLARGMIVVNHWKFFLLGHITHFESKFSFDDLRLISQGGNSPVWSWCNWSPDCLFFLIKFCDHFDRFTLSHPFHFPHSRDNPIIVSRQSPQFTQTEISR